MLRRLREAGPSTQRGLADALGMSPRGVTGLLDGMVAADLVVRTPLPSDRRATPVRLGPEGARLAEELGSGHVELAGILFGELPDGQVTDFVRTTEAVLAPLHERLSADRVGGAASR